MVGLRGIHVIVIVLLFTVTSSAASVGAAPSYVDFGEVERGETVEGSVYITTNLQSPFQLNPSFSSGRNTQKFNNELVNPSELSEEPIENWIRFTQDQYAIDPSSSQQVVLESGSRVNARGQINYYIQVPRDAEPGYHVGEISLNADLSGGADGYGSRAIGESVFQFQFYVPGEADRDIEIQSIRAYRSGQDQATIDTVVRNTGSVTTTLRGSDFAVYDSLEERLENLSIGSRLIEPGERELIRSTWRSDEIEGGEYMIQGRMNYYTGMMSVSESFSLSDTIQSIPSQDELTGGGEDSEPVPLWLIIMALVLLSVLMYAFEIKPVWIFATIGFLGASSIILLFPVSNLLLALPLLMLGIIIYYV